MISDKERREVAQKLRERTKKPMGKSMQCMFTETLGMYAHNICWRNPDKATNRWDVIVNYLADLIDRPMCHDVGGGYEFHCSVCGCVIHIFRDGGFGEDDSAMTIGGDSLYVPHYCPNCGAEVAE